MSVGIVVVAVLRCHTQQVRGAEDTGLPFLPELVAITREIEDVTVVQQPVEDGRGDHRVPKQLAPFTEALVGRQDDAALFVPGRHEGEEGGGGLPGLGPHAELVREGRIRAKAMAAKRSRKTTGAAGEPVVGQADGEVVLPSGGNPQIAKADGDAPVQAYIGRRLDDLTVGNVPDVRKAVRCNSPFYGVEGQGWFLSYHVFARYVKVTFFQGASLHPVPSGAGKDKDAPWVDIYEDGLNEEQLAT